MNLQLLTCPPLINDPTKEPTVHKDKAYVPVTLIINISSDGKDAFFMVYKRGDRDKSLRIGTSPLLYFGV
jgi:hypothetical protein